MSPNTANCPQEHKKHCSKEIHTEMLRGKGAHLRFILRWFRGEEIYTLYRENDTRNRTKDKELVSLNLKWRVYRSSSQQFSQVVQSPSGSPLRIWEVTLLLYYQGALLFTHPLTSTREIFPEDTQHATILYMKYDSIWKICVPRWTSIFQMLNTTKPCISECK